MGLCTAMMHHNSDKYQFFSKQTMKKLLYILLFVPHALFGQDNYSLSFDGVGDYVQLSNIDIAETESFTWQIDIRFDQNVKTSLFTQYSSYSENGYYINYSLNLLFLQYQ